MHWSEDTASTGCSSCFQGFHLEGSNSDLDESVGQLACRKNVCKCHNGVASLTCHWHESVNCFSCKDGYHLEGNICKVNVCKCGHGEASTGVLCKSHGGTGCRDTLASIATLDSTIDSEHLTDDEVMQRFQILCKLSEGCNLLPNNDDSSCSDGFNLADGVFTMGLGFDATKGTGLNSKRLPLIKHDCSKTKQLEVGGTVFDIPGNIIPETNYHSAGSFRTFDSVDAYKTKKSEQAGIDAGGKSFSDTDKIVRSVITDEEQKGTSASTGVSGEDSVDTTVC